ncbi:MAG: uroporphyrinogen-III synthase [Pseudomonadales bacterium]
MQRILTTRPHSEQAALGRALARIGCQAVALPTIEIVSTTTQQSHYQTLKQQMMNIDLYDIVICISHNAASCAAQWLDTYWPQQPLGIQWFAIGKRTQRALEALDIQAAIAQNGSDSEALLALLAPQVVAGKKILILKGNAGRQTLTKELHRRGARVDEALLYHRQSATYSDKLVFSTLYNEALSAILTTSGEALCNLVAIARGSSAQFDLTPLLAKPVVVPSQRVAEIAAIQGFNRITVAAGADNKAMLDALVPAIDSEADT